MASTLALRVRLRSWLQLRHLRHATSAQKGAAAAATPSALALSPQTAQRMLGRVVLPPDLQGLETPAGSL